MFFQSIHAMRVRYRGPMTSKREARLGDLPYTLAELLHETANTLLYRGTWDVNGVRTPVTIKVLNSEHLGPRHVAQLRHEFEITHHLQSSIAYALGPGGLQGSFGQQTGLISRERR